MVHCSGTQDGLGYGREPLERQSSFFGETPSPEFGQEAGPGAWIESSDIVPPGTRPLFSPSGCRYPIVSLRFSKLTHQEMV